MQHCKFCSAAQKARLCLDTFLRKFAYVDPLAGVRITIKFVQIKLDRAAGASDSGKYGLKALHAYVKIHGYGRIDPEGTYSSDRMADKLEHFIGGEHFRLHVEFVFELVVVDARVPGGEDQHTAVRRFEGESLRDASAFDAERLGSQLDRGGGDGEFDDTVLDPEGTKIGAAFFYGPGIPLKM